MTQLFIGISSCQRFEENGWNDALRNTWLQDAKELGIPYKFFHGRGATPKEDVVVVDAGDDYPSLIKKTLEKYRWFLQEGYTHLFHCYHDTYAAAARLGQFLINGYDYWGDFYHEDHRQPWPHESYAKHCQSGAGAFLTRAAVECAAEAFPKFLEEDPRIWEEDLWTGRAIRERGDLKIGHTPGMTCNLVPSDPGPRRGNDILSCHLSTIHPGGIFNGVGRETEWKYRPEYMYKLHREWKES